MLFASEHNYFQMINLLSLISPNLNEEDPEGYTILTHQVMQMNFKMVRNLIARGAQVDYVNQFGLTALHICVEKKLAKPVEYLLFKNANPHLMDLNEMDACDKAKRNGMA